MNSAGKDVQILVGGAATTESGDSHDHEHASGSEEGDAHEGQHCHEHAGVP